MRMLFTIAACVLIIGAVSSTTAETDVRAGLSIEDGKLQDFYFAVSKEYGQDEEKVADLHKFQGIPAEELPVIYYLSKKAGKNPKETVRLRLEGKALWEIAIRYELKPEHFYIPVKADVKRPPYGHALGHFKKEKKRWVRIALTDTDMINLVNLRFMHDQFGVDYEEIINWRSDGESFVDINQRAYHHKHGKPAPSAMAAEERDAPGNGKSKGQKKDK